MPELLSPIASPALDWTDLCGSMMVLAYSFSWLRWTAVERRCRSLRPGDSRRNHGSHHKSALLTKDSLSGVIHLFRQVAGEVYFFFVRKRVGTGSWFRSEPLMLHLII